MALSNAERQRRFITRLKERADAAVTNGAGNAGWEWARQLEAEVAELKAQLQAKPKEYSDAAERRIKRLTTENRNLKAQVFDLFKWRNQTDERGLMPYTTYIKVVRALHSDTVWQNEAEKAAAQAEACRLFTAWGSIGKDRAKRR